MFSPAVTETPDKFWLRTYFKTAYEQSLRLGTVSCRKYLDLVCKRTECEFTNQVLLDLSAASDTVDNKMLEYVLEGLC